MIILKSKKVKIEKNTFKIVNILIVIIILFVCCVVAVQNPEKYTFTFLPSKYLVLILSILGILIIPYLFTYFLKLLLGRRSYFEIDENGIYNGLGFLKEKNILWKDITEIDTIKYQGIWRVRIKVNNNKSYIKGIDFIMNFIIAQTISELQTPIIIDNIYLKCNFQDLSKIIFKYWKLHNSK